MDQTLQIGLEHFENTASIHMIAPFCKMILYGFCDDFIILNYKDLIQVITSFISLNRLYTELKAQRRLFCFQDW